MAVRYALALCSISKAVTIRTAAICNCCLETLPAGRRTWRRAVTLRSRVQLTFRRFIRSPRSSTMPHKGDETLQQLSRSLHENDRSLVELPEVPREHAEGGTTGNTQRLKMILVTASFPNSPAIIPSLIPLRHARRKNGRHVFNGPKPSRRRAEFAVATKSTFKTELARRP